VNAVRGRIPISFVVPAATIALLLPVESAAQADKGGIAGAWTMNTSLSDQTGGRGDQSGEDHSRQNGGGGRRGGYGRGGGGGRGGYGRGGGGSAPAASPDEVARMREAMRDVIDPPQHLVISATDSMIILTSGDGRTVRLSPDGKGIKDDNTKVERKTHWDGSKLVSEVSGLGRGKMTQTFAINPELHQLRVTVQVEASGQTPARTMTHVYDADKP
jgi:hypothetical protein